MIAVLVILAVVAVLFAFMLDRRSQENEGLQAIIVGLLLATPDGSVRIDVDDIARSDFDVAMTDVDDRIKEVSLWPR